MTDASDLLPIAREIPLNRVGRTMARAMALTVGTAALSQVVRSVDVGSLSAERRTRPDGTSRSMNTFMLAAVARTLPDHPFLNARLDGTTAVVPDVVNLGVAVATDEGLLVPVIQRAERLTIDELDLNADGLISRARVGRLRRGDVDAGTFTVSNLGMLGVDHGFALPPPTQAAILLIGRVRPRLELDVGGRVEVVDEASLGLTFDHRFIDGATAAGFLAALAIRIATIADED